MISWFRGPSNPSGPKIRNCEQVVYLGGHSEENGECVGKSDRKGGEPLQSTNEVPAWVLGPSERPGEQSCAYWNALFPALPASSEHFCGHRTPSSKDIQVL